jgi:hypothetical protein
VGNKARNKVQPPLNIFIWIFAVDFDYFSVLLKKQVMATGIVSIFTINLENTTI